MYVYEKRREEKITGNVVSKLYCRSWLVDNNVFCLSRVSERVSERAMYGKS